MKVLYKHAYCLRIMNKICILNNEVKQVNNNYFLSKEYLENVHKYWRAANYVSAAQLYLQKNALLKRPLKESDIKPRLVGHWGTCPGQNFVYAHLNRAILAHNVNMMLIAGPGHGGNFFISNAYLEGTYTEVYPEFTQDEKGLEKLCKNFSFPGGTSSHVAPEVPGSIHEGGELGYSLAHAFGTVLDNPNLITAVTIGDGEAETGPLACSWHGNKFLNPKTDGAVLPILHLNGYKISNPTVLSRISKQELFQYFSGLGWRPYFVEGDDYMQMHEKMARAMDACIEEIQTIQKQARKNKQVVRPVWPMIVLRTPKGWTGPKMVNQKKVEGNFRAHQVPVSLSDTNGFEILIKWLESYHPEELFDKNGKLLPQIRAMAPKGKKRISANPVANGGALLKTLKLPSVKKYGVKFTGHGKVQAQDMLALSAYIRDIFKLNGASKNYRIFCPDEAMSNRLYHVFEEENRTFELPTVSTDEYLSADGRVLDSYLSEHFCEGVLEGYILSGRHGMFASYEAFIRVVDSMIGQHAKWLKLAGELAWRKPISSLNLILTSNVWQQDHNGYTHQEPGLLDHMMNKKADNVGVYLPADANTLICTYAQCTKTANKINAIVASKHPTWQWLSMKEAQEHVQKGISVWNWASTCGKQEPDIVLVSCGDTVTLEALACVDFLKTYAPNIKVRFVNIVNLCTLNKESKDGLTDQKFDSIFTKDKPVIFSFHGYPRLIYGLLYHRNNKNILVHGYEEEGAITTPFDMRVRNKVDRWHLAMDVLQKVQPNAKETKIIVEKLNETLAQHKTYIEEHGIDMPEILNWKWNAKETEEATTATKPAKTRKKTAK